MSFSEIAYMLSPSLWAKECLGFVCDPWQATVIDSFDKRILLNCSRQSGKSTVSSVMALHTLLFRPNSLILMVSPSLRQSGELFQKFMEYFRLLYPEPQTREETKTSLALTNGSRCVSLPGSEATIRGFSAVQLLIIDEAARVEDDLYFAVTPMLAVSKGRLLAISTPFGKRGWFYQEWSNDENYWTKYKVTALNCPRITPDFLESERAGRPESWFRQEYMCEFADTVDSVFTLDQVESTINESVEPLEFKDVWS